MSWSLRKRFLTMSATVSVVALVAAGAFIYYLFERDLRERVHAEIHHNLTQLLANLDIDGDGKARLSQPMADPRFRQPLSGLYWEVDSRNGNMLASRSLWDSTLAKGQATWANFEEPVAVTGPFDEPVLLHVRLVTLGEGDKRRQLRVMVAVNEAEVREPARRFGLRLALSLLALAVAIILVSAAQYALVMTPLKRLRHSVRDIRDGIGNRVSGDYPVEFAPIVDTLNTLLAQKEQTVESARARASNFAHSLKTPLTIVETLVTSLREKGSAAEAHEISGQTSQIKKLVDREMVRARLAAGHGEPIVDAAAVLREVVGTIRLLPRGRVLTIDFSAPPGLALQIDREDFIELAGNLLDNARKWARSRLEIRLTRLTGAVRLTVSDDGPGLSPANMALIAERGRRFDESTEGAGIGLAIVEDIVNAYRLTWSFAIADLGGLEVGIVFPDVRPATPAA